MMLRELMGWNLGGVLLKKPMEDYWRVLHWKLKCRKHNSLWRRSLFQLFSMSRYLLLTNHVLFKRHCPKGCLCWSSPLLCLTKGKDKVASNKDWGQHLLLNLALAPLPWVITLPNNGQRAFSALSRCKDLQALQWQIFLLWGMKAHKACHIWQPLAVMAGILTTAIEIWWGCFSPSAHCHQACKSKFLWSLVFLISNELLI